LDFLQVQVQVQVQFYLRVFLISELHYKIQYACNLGINHYSTGLVKPALPPSSISGLGGWDIDQQTAIHFDPTWPLMSSPIFSVVPWG
jgi:hypothetical protein